MVTRAGANAYVVVGIFLSSLVTIVFKFTTTVNPIEFFFLSYLSTTAAALLLLLAAGRWRSTREVIANRKLLGIMAIIGVANYGLVDLSLMYSVRFTTASISSVIFNTYPLLMLLLIPLILKERVSTHQIAALLLGFAGICVALAWGTSLSLTSPDAVGILLALMASLGVSVGVTLAKRYVYDTLSGIFFYNFFALIIFAIAFVATGATLAPLPYPAIAALLYIGIISSVIYAWMYYKALSVLKTTLMTNLYFITPFLTFLFAFFMLGEQIHAYYLAAALLVAAGVVLQQFDKVGGTLSTATSGMQNYVIFDVTGIFADTASLGVSSSIRSGSRVLALKIDQRHAKRAAKVAGAATGLQTKGQKSRLLISSEPRIAKEAGFARNIVDARHGELVLFTIGPEKEGEQFLEGFAKSIFRGE
ncbi:MAG: EamA family transporter [Candidatus Micrarchaeota archaeon]|nr:EamA family transporter [Candidatus Micrarchaeota archaeon]MDE1847895.1 EamA family transporter [Candidatus Micrarchaeota archaeon]MDE1864521.1 EamA family transporter [Candidatus Micrarchaeota archaeon]